MRQCCGLHSDEPLSRGKGWAVAALLFLLVHAALSWQARQIGVLTGQDDVEYMVLAESLRHGTYREIFRVGEPFHYQYPPGYPALLAGWGAVFGTTFDAGVALSVSLSTGALAILFLSLRRIFDARFAAISVGVLAVNPELVRVAGAITAEPAYLFFSLLALYMVALADGRLRHLVLAAVVALLAALTRTAGITLVVALMLHWLLERRWKLVLIPAAVSAALLGGWLVWSALDNQLRPGSSYIGELRALWSGTGEAAPLLERMPRYIASYVTRTFPTALAMPAVPGTPIDNFVGIVLLGAAALAGFWVLAKRWRPAVIYLLCYALLLAVWLWAVPRFLIPVIPLLLVSVLAGASALGGRVRERLRVPAMLVFAVVLALSGAARSWALVRERAQCERGRAWPPEQCLTEDQEHFFEALRWIDANLPDTAVFLVAKSGALWHYTGRQSARYTESIGLSAASFIPWLERQGAGWVLLASLSYDDAANLAALVRANCSRLRIEAAFPPLTWLFQVSGAVTPEEAAATCRAVDEYLEAVKGRDW